ncbi:MAG TPA: glycosyltransferase family 2 protein [Acidimicrobiales bacterium]|nr:glycosyltransferase family 2 protein [Acidimicrobiales bacterium]
MNVSVVFVNWNANAALLGALASLPPDSTDMSLEVVVIDNGSRPPPSSRQLRACAGREVLLIANRSNLGLAAANNQGLAATTGDLVLLANPDIELKPGALEELVAAMGRHGRAAFTVPRLVHPDGSHQPSAGDLPTVRSALMGTSWSKGGGGRMWWPEAEHRCERVVPRGAEACYLVRRRAVEDFGGQDPGFRLDWEGPEWFDRAGRAGWEAWLAPAAVVVHSGGASISLAGLRWVVQSHAGMYRYLAPRTPPAIRPLLTATVGVRAVLKAVALAGGAPLYRRAQR